MEKISEEVLFKLLKSGNTIKNREINCKEINLEYILLAEFENCKFTSPRTHFTKHPTYKNETITQKISISFKSCSFNELLILKINNFENLSFSNIKIAKSILIHYANCESFNFEDSENINYHIEILGCNFQKRFTFNNNKFVKKGKFHLYENTFQKNTFITKNTLNDLKLEKQYFKDFLDFENQFNEGSSASILYSEFEKVTFSKSYFSNLIFNNCDFLNTTWFENCKKLKNSELKFIACKFEKYSLFDNSKFNKIEILHSKFMKKASFENFETNYFKIHQVTFTEAAYFDDLNKNNNKAIENWDRKTLRAIKQELQKAENRIDFNRFRAYELAAHYEELDWKWNSGFIDKSILFATKISTDFGNSWRKALRFTLIGGFAIYLFLYIIENRNVSIDILNWDNWARLFSGFFRFLLVTDFYNPLETDRVYLTNPFSWVLLIFGKIFIAFGIYEMIQSFRKFKA